MTVELSTETTQKCEEIIARYPDGWKEAAILPVLHLLQREWGYVSLEGLKFVAQLLGMPAARAAGVMSFYPMFHKAPVGRHVIQVCSTLSCALCGAEEVVDYLKEKLKIEVGETTEDGRFTLEKSECIAACEGGPAIRINDELHRYLSKEKLDKMLEGLE
jgi:NADH-quinone oxidoreductase E subunit